MMTPQYEDANRYSPPTDNQPDEPTYLLSQILRYVESWSPHPYHHHYSLEEIGDLLKEASKNLTDEDHGIDTI
jgi:hypothetical protein